MRIDSTLAFVPTTLSLIAAAGVDVPSTNTIDLLGLGVGITASAGNQIIGTPATVFGTDMGVGDGLLVPKLQCTIGTALTTGTSATLTVEWQFAADDGTGNPSTWQTVVASPAITAAQGTAGAVIARLDFPPAFPENLRPRFTRLNFAIPAGTTFTTGTISFAGIVPVRDDTANKYANKNFTVADN